MDSQVSPLSKEDRELEAEFQEWRQLEVTRKFFQLLRVNRTGLQEQWARGQFENPSADADARAEVRVIDRYLELTWKEMQAGLEDE